AEPTAAAPAPAADDQPTLSAAGPSGNDDAQPGPPAAGDTGSAQPWVGRIDPDLLEIFVEEARELLDHDDGLLAQWRTEPGEPAHAVGVQRDLHTLKGGARIAGLIPVGDLTHAIETLLEKPVGERDTAQLIGALETGFDTLNSLVQRVSQGQPIEYPQALIDRLLAMAGQEALADEYHEPAKAAPTRLPSTPLPELLPDLLPDREE